MERIIALRGDHEIWAETISLTEPLNIETQSQESRIFLWFRYLLDFGTVPTESYFCLILQSLHESIFLKD